MNLAGHARLLLQGIVDARAAVNYAIVTMANGNLAALVPRS